MNMATKLTFNYLVGTVLAVFISIFLFGWNEFADKVGGIKSFVGLLAVLAMAGIVLLGINHLQTTDYQQRSSARFRDLLVAFVVTICLGIIGLKWVDLPTGAGMKIMFCLIVIGIAASISTWIGYVEDE